MAGVFIFGMVLPLKNPTKPVSTPTLTPTATPEATPKPTETPKPTREVTPTINDEAVNKACINEDRYLDQIKEECGSMPFPGIEECIQMRTERAEVELKESNLARANKMKELKVTYLQEKAKCDR